MISKSSLHFAYLRALFFEHDAEIRQVSEQSETPKGHLWTALYKAMGIIAVGTEYIIKSAETRALKMVEEIWSALKKYLQVIFKIINKGYELHKY